VQSRNRFVTAEPSPEIRQLEDKLQALQQQKVLLEDEAAALQSDGRLLLQITTAATTVPEESNRAGPTFDEWRQLIAFNAEETRRISSAERDVKNRTHALTQEIKAAQQQLNEARGRVVGRRAVKEVEVRVALAQPGPITLEVAYTVPGASWTPTYRARLDSPTRQVALDYEAQVINRTGEAWDDVALTLSTARPSAGGSAPEAFPWIVEQAPDYQAFVLEAASPSAIEEAAPDTMTGYQATASLAGTRVRKAPATVDSGLTRASFPIAAPATIPSDGTNHRVSINTLDLPAGLRHDTTPKSNTEAFLTAKVTNDSDYPLLPGALAAFVDGAFIAESFLNATMAGEEFDLALGVDDGVSIERTLVNRFVEKTGFTNSGHRVTYEVAIELTNNKSIPVTIELSEALPVSRHEKITVKILQPNERDIGGPEDNNAFKRDENGILTWTGSLAAGASKRLKLSYSIEHPANMDVSGVE